MQWGQTPKAQLRSSESIALQQHSFKRTHAEHWLCRSAASDIEGPGLMKHDNTGGSGDAKELVMQVHSAPPPKQKSKKTRVALLKIHQGVVNSAVF